MTREEKEFVKSVIDHDAKVLKLLDDIKENFNVDAIYSIDNNAIEINITEDVDAVDAVNIKKFIKENIDNVNVVFDL